MNIIIFTDGSCTNNGSKNAKAGYGILYPNKELKPISKPFLMQPITNQRAELYAIYEALITTISYKSFNNIIIYTDSKYSINCVTQWAPQWETNNWKTSNNKDVKNKDIIQHIYAILKIFKNQIKFIHIKSHQKDKSFETINNNIADDLAKKGIK
jgi:ribonuclease HI